MEEVELIDEALVSCYNLQNRIATMLGKLSDIKEEKGINVNPNDCHSKKATKTPKKRKAKDRKKAVINAKSTKKIANTNDDMRSITKSQEKEIQNSNELAEMELAHMFSKLNDSFIEGNSDAYLKSYIQEGEQFFKRNLKSRVRDNSDAESTDILANLNDMIVKVNAETLTKKVRVARSRKSKDKKTKVPESRTNKKLAIKPNASSDIVSGLQVYEESSLKMKELKSRNSSCTSDIESDDSGISSGLRSLQEINSTYAKIDKRFIEVKRSVESVVVGMKHVDEIINRQKGVFHINFACADNETFICRH